MEDTSWLVDHVGKDRFWKDGVSEQCLSFIAHRELRRVGVSLHLIGESPRRAPQVLLPTHELRNIAAYLTQLADELDLTGGAS